MRIRIEITSDNSLHIFTANPLGGRDEHIADSMTFRRKRGIWCKATQQHAPAPSLTPRKVQDDPALVIDALRSVGFVVPPLTEVSVFRGGGGTVLGFAVAA